ncbi:TauD/TfdA dioxygenase family protein [Roseovarius aestuariivivens]|uniref:TauD/TfdA dioxygenase family protein n=1 Tax=Roseovarius aestuariivivens TaxID=1888910 RepID=UPI001080825E|nr:TauD/TfdA family dioxygenase [Roseovarius aestuariivivens]
MPGSPTRSPEIDAKNAALIEEAGATITPLDPIGTEVRGLDLASDTPPPRPVLDALELEMARRGFLVFKNDRELGHEDFLKASCWWGGRDLHSTHGVHPETPDGNPHIFRLSNDRRHGIPDVGPQWHNDGSFLPATFSHSGYHIIRPAEHGGGTHFAHQGLAFAALPKATQERWQRLSSVNSASGVVHPMVHEHPLTGEPCIWLHLGMTGAIIEKLPDADGFRLLDADEMKSVCHAYNDILNAGLDHGYATAFEYSRNDCVFIDNLAIAHRAAPEAHRPAEQQGLRIMHRSTVRGVHDLAPRHGLPQYARIDGPNPTGQGVWQGGDVGFRWDDHIPMRN